MLLKTHGISIKGVGRHRDWMKKLENLRTWDNKHLPKHLLLELKRESERLLFVQNQIKGIDKYQLAQLKTSDLPVMQKVLQIQKLKGIGYTSAWILVMEWFGWRKFNNVKEVGAAAGLTGVRRASGEMSQDQGISKIGNPQIRSLMVELGWSWLRYQPDHPLSLWFQERFSQGARLRRIGIVALARKLLILIWKFISSGELSEGTQLKETGV
jgi:transposase